MHECKNWNRHFIIELEWIIVGVKCFAFHSDTYICSSGEGCIQCWWRSCHGEEEHYNSINEVTGVRTQNYSLIWCCKLYPNTDTNLTTMVFVSKLVYLDQFLKPWGDQFWQQKVTCLDQFSPMQTNFRVTDLYLLLKLCQAHVLL